MMKTATRLVINSPALGGYTPINPPFPAPAGYMWDFISDSDGVLLTDSDGSLLISLFLVG